MEMRTAAEWLNPVKAGGIAAYLIASASCGVAAVTTANPRIARLAAALGLLDAVLLLDIAFDWRWRLYDWLRRQAVAGQWYEQRHWPQVVTLVILAMLLLAAVGSARRRFPSPPGAALAIEGALLSAGCWAMEVISLHMTDSLLYHHAGPFMVISFIWLLASSLTSVGILRAAIVSRRA